MGDRSDVLAVLRVSPDVMTGPEGAVGGSIGKAGASWVPSCVDLQISTDFVVPTILGPTNVPFVHHRKKKNVFSSVAVRCDFSWSHTVLHRFTKSTRKAQRHTFSMIERTKRYGNNMIIFTLTFIYLILLIFS